MGFILPEHGRLLQGISRERERLLRPPCALLSDDSQAAQVQELIDRHFRR